MPIVAPFVAAAYPVSLPGQWGPVLVLLVIGAFALCILFMVGTVIVTTLRNWFSPVARVPAVVMRRWTREYDYNLPTRRGLSLGSATFYEQWLFLVSFDIQGQELEFVLPQRTYDELQEGDSGLLTYKGERFIGFRKMDDTAIEPLDGGPVPESSWQHGQSRLARHGKTPPPSNGPPRDKPRA